jgi:hypothetical protein
MKRQKNVGLTIITKNGGQRSLEMAMSGVQIRYFNNFFPPHSKMAWHENKNEEQRGLDWRYELHKDQALRYFNLLKPSVFFTYHQA